MIFCQRCKKANPLDFEYCEVCGTRLMVVAKAPDGTYYDGVEHALEEHLLERISLLETAVVRANDRFEQLLELATQQATGTFYDHMMLEALTEILTETRAIDGVALETRWRRHVARHYEETAERERLDERCEQIISAFRGAQREQFADLIEEGTLLISEGRMRRGLRMLESALALDKGNAELSFTIGEYFFHAGKLAEATQYLQRSLDGNANNFGARLLLGLLESESGAIAQAIVHLEIAVTLDEDSFAARYALGRLLASENQMSEALMHFKRALTLKPVPEIHYLIGRMYWEQGRIEQALRHLQKAVRLDPAFDTALYSLGWMYWQAKRTAEAREHLQAAHDLNPQDAHYRAALAAETNDELPVPPALQWTKLFPPTSQRRKANPHDARFAELLLSDLQPLSLPLSRRSIRK